MDLPDECWALVLSRLISKQDRDAAALTCRRWRSLEALSRRSLRFVERDNLTKFQLPRLHLLLLQALHIFPNILSIVIHSDSGDLHYSFPRVFQHKGFAQLTFLNLSIYGAQMNDHLLQCLASSCPSLTHLSLRGGFNICDAGMYSLAYGCPLLQFVDMSCCQITDKGIDVLLCECTDMRELSDDYCRVEGWGFRHGKRLEKVNADECYITSAGLAEGLKGTSSLRELHLPYMCGEPLLTSIGECCKGLEVLNLKWAQSLDNVSLEMIAESCKNLRVLNVSWCPGVTFDGWEELAYFGKKLEELTMTGCRNFDSECLLAIYEGCPNLQILKLSSHFGWDRSRALFEVCRPAVQVEFELSDM